MTATANDPRRQNAVLVRFRGDSATGTLFVGDETWGAVEWSEKRGMWCIEDVEGRCLRHASSIRGQAAAKDEAIALAERMVRDGTFPTPQEAKRLRREKRARQPSEIRRRQERAEANRLLDAMCNAERAERSATPFYEIFAEAFDLADPNLWKSNSFAMVRPRLLVEVQAAIARLEQEAHRQRVKYWQQLRRGIEARLARAREILVLLDDGGAR